jgi:small-conductance mechanosensitive channel
LAVLLLFNITLIGRPWAAEPRLEPTEQEKAQTLVLLHEPIVMLQAKFGRLDGAARVRLTHERIQRLDPADLIPPITVLKGSRQGQETREFMVNGKRILVLVEGDLEALDELTLEQASELVRQRLDRVRLKYLELHSTPYLVKAGGMALLASVLFFGLIWSLQWGHRRIRKWLANRLLLQKGLIPHQWRQVAGNVEVRLLGLLTLLLLFMLTYGWLTYVLGLFPHTRAWSEQLGDSLFTLCGDMLEGMIAAMPGLVTVLLIVAITRFFIRMLAILFDRIEQGQFRVQGLHAETIGATRRLLSVVIWLFALTVAYPYLPGADSDAFKGISVFFGLMVTLGSAGIMNHAMSGLVLIYSRALRPGDLVQIGEVEGMVSELNALSTKLVTRQDHEVTLPNAVVVGGKVVNLTRLAGEKGVALGAQRRAEPGVLGGGVVDHRIQDDPHAALVQVAGQLGKLGIGTEVRIHLEVVLGVVLVVARRIEDRVEVERRHPQGLQVMQLGVDARQIPTVEFTGAVPLFVAADRLAPGLADDRLAPVLVLVMLDAQ